MTTSPDDPIRPLFSQMSMEDLQAMPDITLANRKLWRVDEGGAALYPVMYWYVHGFGERFKPVVTAGQSKRRSWALR